MNRSKWLAVLVVMIMVVGLAAVGHAEKKGNNLSTEKAAKVSDEAKAVADLNLAAALAKYGRTTENPMALVVAAQIIKNTSTQEAKVAKKTEGKATADSGTKAGVIDTPEKLFADAKKIAEAKNMDQLSALIDKESKLVATRGSVNGPRHTVERVEAGTVDTYKVKFRGREQARVALQGDGDCDLDLYVYDENGNLVSQSIASGDTEYVEWTPKWTGDFTIRVKNRGSVYAKYILLHD